MEEYNSTEFQFKVETSEKRMISTETRIPNRRLLERKKTNNKNTIITQSHFLVLIFKLNMKKIVLLLVTMILTQSYMPLSLAYIQHQEQLSLIIFNMIMCQKLWDYLRSFNTPFVLAVNSI